MVARAMTSGRLVLEFAVLSSGLFKVGVMQGESFHGSPCCAPGFKANPESGEGGLESWRAC